MDIQLITNNPFILELKSDLQTNASSAVLTGGAIFDLLSNRIVKDWDFLDNSSLKSKLNNIANIVNVSSTATTYEYKGKIIQVLKKDKQYFPFTIEQSVYNIGTGNLTIDKQSFNNKILIPSDNVFRSNDYKEIVNCLRRLKHWEKKGMSMKDLTFNSLLSLIKPLKSENIDEYDS